MKTEPKNIPLTVGQALAWLDKMKIAYRYVPDADLWEFVYDGKGLCHISQWWKTQSVKPHLTRKVFVEKLTEMHDQQLKLHFILHCTHECMFNPPEEVLKEIFRDHNTDEIEGLIE